MPLVGVEAYVSMDLEVSFGKGVPDVITTSRWPREELLEHWVLHKGVISGYETHQGWQSGSRRGVPARPTGKKNPLVVEHVTAEKLVDLHLRDMRAAGLKPLGECLHEQSGVHQEDQTTWVRCLGRNW